MTQPDLSAERLARLIHDHLTRPGMSSPESKFADLVAALREFLNDKE